MAQSISNRERAATSSARKEIDQAWGGIRDLLLDAVTALLSKEATPASFADFEGTLAGALRELGRCLLEQAVNQMETAEMKRTVVLHGLIYRRLKARTRNQRVSTSFGDITVRRFGYRHCDDRHCPEPCIFPLELRLGLIRGVTPALGSRIARRWRERHSSRRSTGCAPSTMSASAPAACASSSPS